MKEHGRRGKIVLFVGRLVDQKDPELLLESFAHVVQEEKDAKLWIVGRGPLEQFMRRKVQSLGLDGKVSFYIGWASWETLAKMYNEASVFVCTSLYEGGPKVVVESAACGTPFVTTSVGIIPETFKDGEGGFIVNDRNPEIIAERVVKLLGDQSLRERMGRIGRSIVEREFEWNKAVKRYADTLQQLVGVKH